MADDYIYDVHHVARDYDRSLICRCPHCQEITGLDGDDVEDVQGEQYKCRCGGWFQIDSCARRVKGELPANKGIPDE
ncbi:MAG: hypothetical protein KJ890_15565 [Gammaproteobacteria bacterium]|uniref:hypothetical protein n=1 Tax=Stutzerimonas stutzeri TaxID=316 RepID=UPI00083958A2|nr:hypothetical protein [Stutzerimonas stutzeri]MBU0564907.1 hypothetical protein [Gammaproteobacteria bacterium]MBU1803847.1 hypothetical protein [Gammaproteobacteria bacterium]OCX57170.1 hypothetical protein BFM99_13960 [Stutzerimonas stutzeri]